MDGAVNSRLPAGPASMADGTAVRLHGRPAATVAEREPGLPAFAGGIPVRGPERPLPFGALAVGEEEIAAVANCLRSGWIGPGQRVEEFEREFANYKSAPYSIAVSSGTAALQLALFGIGIQPGDEVIVPSMTFPPSLHTIFHAGAVPVMADCQRDTFCIDPEDAARRVTRRTKAILAVHMCGRCCDLEALSDIARRHRLRILEDCAHAIEASSAGRPSGLGGDVGCFSFYATKNLTTGDGGMVLTRDRRLYRRMRRVSLQGLTSGVWTRYVSGDRSYEVISTGFRCAMNDIAASLGLVQLRHLEQRWSKRERLWQTYLTGLRDLPLTLPPPASAGSRHAYHLFSVLTDSAALRSLLMQGLRAEHIGFGSHYRPAHMQRYFRRKLGIRPGDLPNAAYVGERTLSLPLSTAMSEQDVLDVCLAIRRIVTHAGPEWRAAG